MSISRWLKPSSREFHAFNGRMVPHHAPPLLKRQRSQNSLLCQGKSGPEIKFYIIRYIVRIALGSSRPIDSCLTSRLLPAPCVFKHWHCGSHSGCITTHTQRLSPVIAPFISYKTARMLNHLRRTVLAPDRLACFAPHSQIRRYRSDSSIHDFIQWRRG